MPVRLVRTGAGLLSLLLASAALFAASARADDPTPPPTDPPAVTLPAEPDPSPDPSPRRSAPPTPKPTRSKHDAVVSSRPQVGAAAPARLPNPLQKRTEPAPSTPRARVRRPTHRHASRVARLRARRHTHATSAPQVLRRPTHERLAVGAMQPLAARADASSGRGATTPLLISTAALLVGVLGLFVLRMLSPRLVAVTGLPSRSRTPPRGRPARTRPPRTPARPAARVAPAPPPATSRPVPPKLGVEEPRRAVTPEEAGYRLDPPRKQQALAPTCEIRVFRGYVKSQFYAAVAASDGRSPYAAGTSPWFRWRDTAAPSPEPDIVGARDQLLKVLAADGWVRVGQGAEWYSDRLERQVRGL